MTFLQDLKFGLRLLRRTPWFTLAGVLSLAVGLGAGLALFIFMNGLLYRPIQGRDTAEVQRLFTSTSRGSRYGSSSLADFRAFEAAPGVFRTACATARTRANVTVDGQTTPVPGAIMTGGCFATLGLRAHAGRLLVPTDDAISGDTPAIVISYSTFVQRFGGDNAIIGKSATLNGQAVTMVGVTEPGFSGLSLDNGAAFFAPASLATALLSPKVLTDRSHRFFVVYARLADGVTSEAATERLTAVAAQLRTEDPISWTQQDGSSRSVTVAREIDSRFANGGGETEMAAMTLAGIVGLAAMACMNLATMVMARGAGRTRELNIRLSLGASRGRIIRQLATESLLVSVGGIVIAGAVIAAALHLFNVYRPVEVPAFNVGMDWRVAAVATLLALLAPMFFGLAPGAHALRLAIAEGLRARAPIVRRRRIRLGAREILIAAQVTVSFALLVSATLFLKSLAEPPPGASNPITRNLTIVPVELNTITNSIDETHRVTASLLEAAARTPDVDGATLAGVVPMTGSSIGFSGRDGDRPGDPEQVFDANVIGPGYFRTTGVNLIAGRDFSVGDTDRSAQVAIVSESLARELWQTTAAVGRTLQLDEKRHEVIGVVADVPYRSFTATSHPVLYIPAAQSSPYRFLIHAHTRNAQAIARLTDALRSVDARVEIGSPRSMNDYVNYSRIEARLVQWASGTAGVLQLGLALMATWGLVAYAVQRRTAEIAVRRALGATDSGILKLVMKPSLWLLAIGGIAGSGIGILAAQVLISEFSGLAPLDPVMIVPAAGLLTAVVVIAAWIPARRAIAIQPAAALRAGDN
ncbi:MAG TPA: ABC transporter permease [Vicinamibacterales bacterium]|nr:ABC transporter permease [Vicinamibacterales bacterium]